MRETVVINGQYLTEEMILEWSRSTEGQDTFIALQAIKDYQHSGGEERLIRLFGEELVSKLPPQSPAIAEVIQQILLGETPDLNKLQISKLGNLKSKLPVTDIHTASYHPLINRLFVSPPDTFLYEAGQTVGKLAVSTVTEEDGSSFIVGMTAQVKSNGWRIFDTIDHGSHLAYGVIHSAAMRISAPGLAQRGFILLDREGWQYKPVLP